jgi:general secretion pathway protein L
MPPRLILRLHPDGNLSWLSLGEDGRARAGSPRGAPPAQTLAAAEQIVVLVPGEDVLITETAAVTRQRSQLAKAVPYALEDQLVSPVEELHFALPEHIGSEQIAVAVVAKKTLKSWLERLTEEGITPDALLPDTLALPRREVGSTLCIDGERALLRLDSRQALAVQTSALPEFLELISTTNQIPLSLDVYDFRSEPPLRLIATLTSYHERLRDPLLLFSQGLRGELPVNLLQGEFAPGHRQAPVQRLWRFAALLTGAAILLGLSFAVADQWRLKRESANLDQAMRDLLHEAFPQVTRDEDPARMMDSEFTRLRSGAQVGGLLRVLSQIAPILGSTTRVVTQALEYRNGTLEIGVRAPDVPTLDAIRERLATLPGLKPEVTVANPVGGGVDGRLRITGAAQ